MEKKNNCRNIQGSLTFTLSQNYSHSMQGMKITVIKHKFVFGETPTVNTPPFLRQPLYEAKEILFPAYFSLMVP